MTLVRVSNVWKSFQEKRVLKNVTIEMKKCEFVTLFGPNGCGKTTLLNLIAGVMEPDRGTILLDNMLPREQIVGYVFQNYRDSLLPWRTNMENIAFPLEVQGISKKERTQRVKRLLREAQVTIPLDNYPYQSSGGEQQLVAFLREIVAQPKLIIMDEPFSSLHDESRVSLRVKIREISERLGLTILFVTHDVDEAIQLGDRILVMDSKQQYGVRVLGNTLKKRDARHTVPFRRMRARLLRERYAR